MWDLKTAPPISVTKLVQIEQMLSLTIYGRLSLIP